MLAAGNILSAYVHLEFLVVVCCGHQSRGHMDHDGLCTYTFRDICVKLGFHLYGCVMRTRHALCGNKCLQWECGCRFMVRIRHTESGHVVCIY